MRIGQSTEYSITYRNMLGVDFSMGPSESGVRRYAYLENMYRDYESGDGSLIESVPGFRRILSLGERIHGIYAHKNRDGEDIAVVHAGASLYAFKVSERDSLSEITPIASIEDKKSSAFRFGKSLYLLDGSNIVKVTSECTASFVSQNDNSVYIPTTFYNGERIEQKNLLTDRFREKYVIGALETVIYGTPDLLYTITDEKLGLCSVVGIDNSFSGVVNIPSYAKIGNKLYKVDEISDNAFLNNTSIYGLRLGIGLYRIGCYAFSGCTSLSAVYASYAPKIIDDYAFKNCERLKTFYIGSELEKIGTDTFAGCEAFTVVRYAADEKSLREIENSEAFNGKDLFLFMRNETITVEIPINTPLAEIITVMLGERVLTDYVIVAHSDGKSSIVFTITDRKTVEGKEVVIYARAAASADDSEDGISDFISSNGFLGTGFDAIRGCNVCENFDGRVFLSGNPALPGIVFFSSGEGTKEAPLYFGSYNYFCDGLGVFGVSSMLSCADSLLVFKNADDGGGSIFYHTPRETGISFMPKIYPVSYTHNGIGAIGESISFFDDPIFISKTGISAIDKKSISLERSIACRSHNVNALLLRENLKNVSLAEWCGYLAVGVNGKIFLADSRATFTHESGYREYEWYYMKDVGTYENDKRVYRFSSISNNGYLVSPIPEAIAQDVYSEIKEGKTVYYAVVDNERYEVYPTEEKTGGIFHPLVSLCSFEGDILFFGTDNGDICVFNNDKRGIAPKFISESADFDPNEYEGYGGRRIHPSFYTFDTHSMRCGIRTAPSDCQVAGLSKNTVKHSLVLKCRLDGAGSIKCEVKTNRSGYTEYASYPNAVPDFSDWSFASLTLDSEECVSLPINEKEKNWVDKEIAVYCDDFRTPIGVYSISYRYTLRGKIKHT